MKIDWRVVSLLAVFPVLSILISRSELGAEEVSAADAKFFREDVLPLLQDSCQRCHGEKKQKSGLRLDSREALLTGGENGPAIVAGKPDDSLLMKVLQYKGDIQMPPDAKLSDERIDIFKKWIEKGAPWPAEKK